MLLERSNRTKDMCYLNASALVSHLHTHESQLMWKGSKGIEDQRVHSQPVKARGGDVGEK